MNRARARRNQPGQSLIRFHRACLAIVAMLAFQPSGRADQPPQASIAVSSPNLPFRLYRVPFESVTRLFPPGTELESISHDEFLKLARPLESKANETVSPAGFLGSAVHELELKDGLLKGVSRFGSPPSSGARSAFRVLPSWLDSESFASSGLRLEPGAFFVAPDGRILLDARTQGATVRWSVPPIETGRFERYPLQFPEGITTRIRVRLPAESEPSSPNGGWVVGNVDGNGDRYWLYVGSEMPGELWVRTRGNEAEPQPGNEYDADATTQWTIAADEWTGVWAATLRSSGRIASLEARLANEVRVVKCTVDGVEKSFGRSGEALSIPIDSFGGRPVLVRVELRRAATHESEVTWPSVRPVGGRWFLSRSICVDGRSSPFLEVLDDENHNVPVTVETITDRGASFRRMRFSSTDADRIVRLRAPGNRPEARDQLFGEFLVRSRFRVASLRLIAASASENRPIRYFVRSAMKPFRVDSYRASQSGQRTNCDYEITIEENGFSILALPSDPDRGPLTFDILLAEEPGAGGPQELSFPTLERGSGRRIESKWTVVSDDSRIRLTVENAEGVRWLPLVADENRAGLPGTLEAAPQAKPLAAWSSETGATPGMGVEFLAESADGMTGKTLRIFVGTKGNRQFRVLTFETNGSDQAGARELIDKALAQAVIRRISDMPRDLSVTEAVDSSMSLSGGVGRGVRYRMQSIPVKDLPAELTAIARTSGQQVEVIFMAEARQFGDSMFRSHRPDASVRPEILDLAKATADFLKSNRLLPSHFEPAQCEIGFVEDADSALRLAGDFAESMKTFEQDSGDPEILSEQVTLLTRVFADGSARHRLTARIMTPTQESFRIRADEGCELIEIRLDGRGIPFEEDQPGKSVRLFPSGGRNSHDLRIDFETRPGVLEGSGFPLHGGLADVAVDWTIVSEDGTWGLDSTGMTESPTGAGSVRTERGRPFRTSVGNLGHLRLVRLDSEAGLRAWAIFGLSLLAWVVAVSVPERLFRSIGKRELPMPAFAVVSFAAVAVQDDSGFAIAAGLVMCLAVISMTWISGWSRRIGVTAACVIFALVIPEIAAQPSVPEKPFVVALPYESIDSALAPPKRAIMAADELKRLRRKAIETLAEPSIPPVVIGTARHIFEAGEAGSVSAISNYRIESTRGVGQSSNDDVAYIAIPADDALQVRAFLGASELPVRVNRTTGLVEIGFDRKASGEMTLRKTYPAIAPGADLRVTVLPAIGARLTRSAGLDRAEEFDWTLSTGKRRLPVPAATEIALDLVSEFRISNDSRREAAEKSDGIRAWFTAVRSHEGIQLYVRVSDDSKTRRTLSLAEGVRFMEATDCDATILPDSAEGSARVRIAPFRDSFRIRLWVPLDRADDVLGQLVDFAPALPSHRSVVRLATSSDVSGEWGVVTDSTDFSEDPFEQDSAASETDSTIRKTVEIADWRTLRWRFEVESGGVRPQVEALITLEDQELISRFGIAVPISGSPYIVRESLVSFDPATKITSVTGPGFIDFEPQGDAAHQGRIRFVGLPGAVSRFVIRTRSKVNPVLPGDPAAGSKVWPLPWPRFDGASLAAGNLIVERRIDPESTFRASPLRLENGPIESLGEIRSPDTPSDVRRWLYRFRGDAALPSVVWQLPGVFCEVFVEHSLHVEGDHTNWQCQLRYEPQDGPLASMIFEVVHPEEFPIFIEPDRPKDFRVERTREDGRTRFLVRPRLPMFGTTTIRIRGESTLGAAGQFDLPGVSPLGHGRVEKSVGYRVSGSVDASSPEVLTQGMAEVAATAIATRAITPVRFWKFRSADAAFRLRFPPGIQQVTVESARSDAPAADPSMVLSDLAAECGDDGFVHWYATADVRILKSQGIAWPESLGEIQAFSPDGTPIELTNRKGVLFAGSDRERQLAGGCLIKGRFRADRWSEWRSAIVGGAAGPSMFPRFFAFRNSSLRPLRHQGAHASMADWLGAGALVKTSADSPAFDDAKIGSRVQRFRDAWIVQSMAGFDGSIFDGIPFSDAEAAVAAPDSKRAASDYIDDRLLTDSGRWRFYRFEASVPPSGDFVRTARRLAPDTLLLGFRRTLIAAFLTFAVVRCRGLRRTGAECSG